MRRILLSVIISALYTSAFAQEPVKNKTRYYRHEVNVGLGLIGVRSGWSNDYERSVMNQFGLVAGSVGGGSRTGEIIYEGNDSPNLRFNTPLMSTSYYYHFNKRIAVGGLFGGCRVHDWLGYLDVHEQEEVQKTGYTYVKGTSLFLMPSLKWSWLNNRWCSLYMKATAGLHYHALHLDSETIPKEQTEEYDKNHLSLGYYFTPFGWEIGKQKVRWFMEFGFGSNTNFQIGLTYRFRKY